MVSLLPLPSKMSDSDPVPDLKIIKFVAYMLSVISHLDKIPVGSDNTDNKHLLSSTGFAANQTNQFLSFLVIINFRDVSTHYRCLYQRDKSTDKENTKIYKNGKNKYFNYLQSKLNVRKTLKLHKFI